MENKNETLLTSEVYASIVERMTNEIIELKKSQGETIDRISAEKEVLKRLKQELKQIKTDICISKKSLNSSKKELRTINNNLVARNNTLVKVSTDFLVSKESYVDLNKCLNLEVSTKKR